MNMVHFQYGSVSIYWRTLIIYSVLCKPIPAFDEWINNLTVYMCIVLFNTSLSRLQQTSVSYAEKVMKTHIFELFYWHIEGLVCLCEGEYMCCLTRTASLCLHFILKMVGEQEKVSWRMTIHIHTLCHHHNMFQKRSNMHFPWHWVLERSILHSHPSN